MGAPKALGSVAKQRQARIEQSIYGNYHGESTAPTLASSSGSSQTSPFETKKASGKSGVLQFVVYLLPFRVSLSSSACSCSYARQ